MRSRTWLVALFLACIPALAQIADLPASAAVSAISWTVVACAVILSVFRTG